MAIRLALQELAGRQERPPLLARLRLHMHRTMQIDPHHRSNSAHVVAIGLVRLGLEERLHMARRNTDHRRSGARQLLEQSQRHGPSLEPYPFAVSARILHDREQIAGVVTMLHLTAGFAPIRRQCKRWSV